MDRRIFLGLLSSIFITNNLFSSQKTPKPNIFNITMKGDLDDDLFVIKATPREAVIKDIFQMHNPSNKFQYNGKIYDSIHIPGYIDFNKDYKTDEEDIYVVMLANEREDAQLTKRVRSHYKSEKLTYNNEILLPPLMPEYDSVPNYPKWFLDEDTPILERRDTNGDLYNYYHLFENSVVQAGFIFPRKGKVTIKLYDKGDTLLHTYRKTISTTPSRLISVEEEIGEFNTHPFTEVGNILNDKDNIEIENNNFVTNIIIEYENKIYILPCPYPMMYPNLIFGVANEKHLL